MSAQGEVELRFLARRQRKKKKTERYARGHAKTGKSIGWERRPPVGKGERGARVMNSTSQKQATEEERFDAGVKKHWGIAWLQLKREQADSAARSRQKGIGATTEEGKVSGQG